VAKHQLPNGFYESEYDMRITDSYAIARIGVEARGPVVVRVNVWPTGGGMMIKTEQGDTEHGAAYAFDRPGPSYKVKVTSGPEDFDFNVVLT
jgi:hypothetical protein